MKIQYLKSAKHDLKSGFNFYEAQEKGLGLYFLETLYSDIDSLKLFSSIYPKVYGYQRMLSKRFPYAIYYKIENKYIRIYAVINCRRSPIWIKNKLK